jgi:2-dehydro-3-deoxygluconokinase
MESNRPVVTMGETMGLFSAAPGERIERAEFVRVRFVGAESNTAIGLARLGHRVRWLSAVGDDPIGWRIVKTMRGEGVDVDDVVVSSEAPTGLIVKDRRPGREPAVYYYRRGSAFSRVTPNTFAPSQWRDARLIYLTGITPALSEGCREAWLAMLRDANAAGIGVWMDVNYRRKLWAADEARGALTAAMASVEVVLVGMSEGMLLTGEDEPARIAEAVLELGVKQVILKTGEDGARSFGEGGRVHAPAVPVREVVDPIGAGDAFAAGVISGVLEGLDMQAALARGNAAGAAVCRTDGDWEGLPTRAELAESSGESDR